MVFSLKSVNLEEVMSEENVNCIHQTVDTHPKLDADFFFKVSFPRWLFIELLGIYLDMVTFPLRVRQQFPTFLRLPWSQGDLEVPHTTRKLNWNCVKEQSSWSEATMKIRHYLLSPPSPQGHPELGFSDSCFLIFCSVGHVLLPCSWHFTAIQQDITATTKPDKWNFKVIWEISLSR